jgi:hypothetical protein
MKSIPKKVSILTSAALCAAFLSSCGTNVAEHTNTYFNQMTNVITTAVNAATADRSATEGEEQVDENALATPANFAVDEAGNYSFDGVENAQYYYIFVYTDENSMDATAQSEKIIEDGSGTYTGNLNDFCNFTYETWNIRVVAYPDYENSDYSASPTARCDYVVSGAVEYQEPTVDYMWTVTSNKLTVKMSDMEYGQTAYPTSITVTLTNKADANDVVTVAVADVSSSSVTAETTECKADASYAITMDFAWDENYVTNPSYSTEGGEAQTSSEENLISGNFFYSSAIFNNFDFPHVKMNFDPVNGGDAGYWYNDGSNSAGSWGPWGAEQNDDEDTDKNCYFEATPKAAEDGARYSYDVVITSPSGSITASPKLSPGSGSTDAIYADMNIYDDGTFSVEIEYQYIRTDAMNAAVYYVPGVICYGVYTENSDGTLNLSYDHENAEETDYAIVTELTGKAAEAAANKPQDEDDTQQEGGMPEGGNMPEDSDMPEGDDMPQG